MPPETQQCPFCQLIDNPQQLLLVGETDNFYAWLEINPRAKGHSMIVPKKHIESVMDLELGKYREAMKLTREVMEKAVEGLGADGVSAAMNVEEAGGQMVPHAYIQVFPRFEEEENAGTPIGAIFPQREDLQPELENIQEQMESVKPDFSEAKAREPHPESQRFKEELREEKREPDEEEDRDSIDELGSRTVSREEVAEENEEKEDESQEETDNEEGGNWDGKSFEWR